MVLRKISDRQLTSGVRTYHRRLSRLSSSFGAGGFGGSAERVSGSVPGAMIGFSAAALRLHQERYGAPSFDGSDELDRPHDDGLPVPTVTATTSPATAARRRQVVSVLGGATVFFLLIGTIPGARVLWDVALLTLACTAAYVALLIHFHRLAVERAQKVIALETRRHVSAALESRRQVVAVGARYGAGGYGDEAYRANEFADASSYARPVQMSGSGWSVTSGR